VDLRAIRVLSLCSGVGGLDLGVRLALPAARTTCYVEREAYCISVLLARIQDEALDDAPVWTDVRSFDGLPWRGTVDLIIGGYPCQPFSVAGQRRGAEDERHLWPAIARIIAEIRPLACFFENVPGHLTLGFREVRGELESMGYRVEAGLFTAAEVGAPHQRERLFILADAQRNGGPGRRRAGDLAGAARDAEGEGLQRERSGDAADDCGAADVADGGGERLEGDGEGGPEAGPAGRGGGAEVLFPPGPGDRAGWERLLAADPALEPALRGDADGLADRVDRLRACGNGVVPLVAAYALRTLLARSEREGERMAGEE